MYVPIMKVRAEEKKVSKKLRYCFSEKIIPLYEILKDSYETRYKTDEQGNFVMELKPGAKRRNKIKLSPTEEDLITLEELNLDGAVAFIDFFRFEADAYGGNKIDINQVELAYKLSRDEEEYINRLKSISSYENFIPVISLKNNFTFNRSKLISLIKELKLENNCIALRIEDKVFDSVKEVVEEYLDEEDYLLYDIKEQNIDSKVMEIYELNECDIKSKKILLNSPRKAKLKNSEYENCEKSILIDNSVVDEYQDYEFDGFGDYGGLKDQLPTTGGGNGKGAALGLVYNFEENAFYSFCNYDTNLGMGGYIKVIDDILKFEHKLNSDGKCPFYKEVNKRKLEKRGGSWATWNNLTLTKYIYEIYLSIKK
ncbi:hypothetical protein BH721_01275 [Clostridium baratii]|uniref:beta family protein n=1 Tax=Clostridium baratii TaxID=1561 RepID=UPI0009A2E940|nr:hypothetical protein [Clostridium baratii]OPF51559.1 hypothetical protein A1M12_03200 [Clostridium baratii]OPF55370.1 hypothetical protein BH721_01275 [Clostridium baratii]OPF57653.1 hypothetical protein BH724_08530 [Clostridium baratii]OPF60249.1 hypothetical protein BH725_06650 [Clostridium baratii]